jgi:hypothetical protein
MKIFVKRNNGKIIQVNLDCEDIHIGDYVHIKDRGHQYCSYTLAFNYLWGNKESIELYKVPNTDNIWKVINIVVHGSFYDIPMCHIRNRRGDNVIMSIYGLAKSNFHKRNRTSIKDIVIYQMPYLGDTPPHDWHEKLWDFFENGKIVKRKQY